MVVLFSLSERFGLGVGAERCLMTSPKLWLTETMANETDTSLFRTVSDGFRRFRTVSDGFEPFSDGFRRFRTVFGPFRTVSGRVPAVSDDSNPNFKKFKF